MSTNTNKYIMRCNQSIPDNDPLIMIEDQFISYIHENLKKVQFVLLFSGGIRSLLLLYFIVKRKVPGCQVIHLYTGRESDQLIEYITKIERFFSITILSLKAEMTSESFSFNTDECCNILKITPLVQKYKNHNNITLILGTDKKESDRFFMLLNQQKEQMSLYTPLINISQEIIYNRLVQDAVPLCSLYSSGYSKTDCDDCSQKKVLPVSRDLSDEEIIKEKLRKLGYL